MRLETRCNLDGLPPIQVTAPGQALFIRAGGCGPIKNAYQAGFCLGCFTANAAEILPPKAKTGRILNQDAAKEEKKLLPDFAKKLFSAAYCAAD